MIVFLQALVYDGPLEVVFLFRSLSTYIPTYIYSTSGLALYLYLPTYTKLQLLSKPPPVSSLWAGCDQGQPLTLAISLSIYLSIFQSAHLFVLSRPAVIMSSFKPSSILGFFKSCLYISNVSPSIYLSIYLPIFPPDL